MSPNHASAAIGVAGVRSDGLSHVEVTSRGGVVDHRPGIEWVIPRLVELKSRQPNFRLSIAAGSAAESLVPDITAVGVAVDVVKGANVPAACGLFLTMASAEPGTLRHLGQPALSAALAGAAQVNVGDGAWKWARRRSSTDITPLYAVTVALWAAHKRRPVPNVW